jgi:hypothetical protein
VPLHLITGPAASGKSRLVHEPVLAAAARGERATLVLPTAADARRSASVLAARGVIGVRLATFSRFIEGLWFEYGDGRGLVSPVLREMLVSQAVKGCSLTHLAASAQTPGFTRLMGGVCSRVTSAIPGAALSGKAAEIASVIEAYQETLNALGLVEPAAAAARLATTEGVVAGVLGVAGFTDLAEHQELLLGGLSQGSDVYVSVAWEASSPATEAMDALVERLSARCDTHTVIDGAAPHEELEHVAARLFRPCDPPLVASGAVQLAEAEGPEAECARIAEMVKSWVAVDGVAPERIAVGFRSLQTRASYLQVAMESAGLTAVVDHSAPFRSTPLGAAALALIDTAAGPGGRERLLAFVQSPFSGIEAQTACELDARWRQHRETRPDALLGALLDVGPLVARAVRAAQHVARNPLDNPCVEQWQILADTLLELGAPTRPFGSRQGLEDVAAHTLLLDSITDIASACPAATLADVIGAVQDGVVASGATERPGTVLVTEVHRLRGRRFECVAIGGLTSGEFSSERQDPLIATILPSLGMAPGVSERLSERMLFHTLVTRASRRLGLVRQTVDAEGQPLRASVFWEEMLDLYRPVSTPDDGQVEAAGGLAVGGAGAQTLLESAPAFSPGREALRAEFAERGVVWRSNLGSVDRELLEELSGADQFRVTEIEAYASCPYRWFWSEKLRTQPLDREIGAAERGALAHRILAGFYRDEFPGLGVARLHACVLGEAIEGVRRSSTAVVTAMRTPVRGLEEELTVASCRAWAEAVVADDVYWLPGFEPAGVEVAFGDEAPFVFGGARLLGRFDRADVCESGVVVTDYKSSKRLTGASKLIDEGLIQVIAYAQAASELYDRPVAGGLYRSLQSLQARGFVVEGLCDLPRGGKAGDVLGPQDFSALRDSAEELVARCVEGIRAGRIAPDPISDKACSYCGATAFCPSAKASTW